MSAPGPSCGRPFSPLRFWAQVGDAQVQDQLRCAFTRWGLPLRVRVDNGKPWGSTGEWPPVLALWLLGLGVEVVWNPPRRPQDNGVVERSQGTGKRWAEPGQCQSAAELQARVDEDDELQRESYPYVRGRSRSDVWPSLRHSGRAYSVAAEGRDWELRRVLDHLGGCAVARRVDQSGKVSLYDRLRYVGVRHAGRTVTVLFDPERREWVYADDTGQQLRHHAAEEIDADAIRALWPNSRRQR